ncbi:MAG: glycosyltransferase [SAR324 cluster bacterium]|nr:glycosyltransferase [SAR324 cluster bacterium]
MSRIKIVFIIDHLHVGGTETQLLELVRGLDKTRFEPHVLCLKEKGRTAQAIEQIGIPVELVWNEIPGVPKTLMRVMQTLQLSKTIKRISPDMVQTFLLTANIFGTVAAKLAGVPRIIASERSVINTDSEDKPARNVVFRFVSRWIDSIFGNSKMVEDYLIQQAGIPSHKVSCIYNGIAAEKFDVSPVSVLRQELGLESDTKLIGMIARLVPQKNYTMLIEAAVQIHQEFSDFRVLIIGEGNQRAELEQLIRDKGLEQTVILLGNRDDVPSILKSLDIFVLTSRYEGLPNVVMEAMCAGLPVVATNAGGTGELVVHGKTGFLVSVDDLQMFVAFVRKLLRNDVLAKEMGESGMKHMQQNFSTAKMVSELERLYQNLYSSLSSHTSTVWHKTPVSVFPEK